MKSFNQSQNEKARRRITEAINELEAAQTALAQADSLLAKDNAANGGELHADALELYDKAGCAMAAAFVGVKALKERAKDFATKRPSAEVIPFNAETRARGEIDGLHFFTWNNEKEGEK